MKRFATIFWQASLVALLSSAVIIQSACTVDEVLTSIDAGLQVAQDLNSAVGTVLPADAALIALLENAAIAGITSIQTAYDAYEKNKTADNKQNVVDAANLLQKNLPTKNSEMKFSNPVTTQKATAWTNLLVDCAASIETQLTGTSSTPRAIGTTAHPQRATPVPYSAEAIKAAWTNNVCFGDSVCGSLVKIHHKKRI